MQRRAAALYAAFFLVLAAGSYGMLATASAPTVSVDNPDHQLTAGSELTVDGRTYGVDVEAGEATLSWTEPDATYTTTWAAGDEVTLENTTFIVSVPEDTDPRVVELTEDRPLPDDAETTEVNGTEYVVVDGEGEGRELVPVDAYLDDLHGPAETRTLEASQSIDYDGNLTTVSSIEGDAATLEWMAPRTNTIDAAEGDVLELNGIEYVAHFPDDTTLILDEDVEGYEQQLAVQDKYDERVNGLWGVSILSVLGVVILLGLSYLPSRY